MKNQIADYVPMGHDNAITLSGLVYITGLDERKIRNEISKSDELIINMQDGCGYFRPLPEDIEYVIGWQQIIRSRIRELLRRTKEARLWVRQVR